MRNPLDIIKDLQSAFEANDTPYKPFSRDNSSSSQQTNFDLGLPTVTPKTSSENHFDWPFVDPDADTVRIIKEVSKPLAVRMSTGGKIWSTIKMLGLSVVEIDIFLEEALNAFGNATRLDTDFTYDKIGWRYSYTANQHDKKNPLTGTESIYYQENLVLIHFLLLEAVES